MLAIEILSAGNHQQLQVRLTCAVVSGMAERRLIVTCVDNSVPYVDPYEL
jgi:hypothetical protein